MEIKYLGHSSFHIKTKTARIITDPFDSKTVGLKYPTIEADIVTISHNHLDHNVSNQIGGNPLVLDWPGEFEKNAVRIYGFQSFHDAEQGTQRGENVMYKFEADDISILHCGDIGHMLTAEFVDKIEGVDILMIPTGGFYTINATQAVTMIKQLDPTIVIPMHYGHSALNQEGFADLQSLDEFLKLMGAEGREPIDKLIIKKEDLAAEDTRVIPMSISL